MITLGASPLPTPLPPLREELQLQPAAANTDGSPAWTIQDPVANTFYRIGWLEFELLCRWHLADPAAILATATQETLLKPVFEELVAVYRFLAAHHLLADHSAEATGHLRAAFHQRRPALLTWLLHNYLFFRIPLVRPARFLQQLLPWLAWIASPPVLTLLAALTGLGLVLTFRQWDVFFAALQATATPSGMVGYLLALAITKSIHELGHALTATRYGLRVAHMGVAFLVLWPVLYTDTGEVWRLRERRQRIHIVAAGIVSELILGGLALLAWNLAGDSESRQVFLFMATTAWVLSLLLNLSPFMRYDGYFLLSDLLDLPNLHERSFALARTAMRRWLLGWNDPYPESLPPRQRIALIVFAFVTWTYRLVVYLGIAAAVYHYFFKLLGIFLFLVEISWFVARPIRQELILWQERRAEIRPGRRLLGLCLTLVFVGLWFIPWRQQIVGHGWAHPHQVQVLYSPLPAQLMQVPVTTGQVDAGALLFTLRSPEIQQDDALAGMAATVLQQRIDALLGISQGEEIRAGLAQQKRLHDIRVQGRRIEAERLQLRAPFAGVLTDIDPTLVAGSWVSSRQPLAVLVDPTMWMAEIYVGQAELARLEIGAGVRLYPENEGLRPLTGVVTKIDAERVQQLPLAMLHGQRDGIIPATLESNGTLVPRDVVYRVHVRLDGQPGALHMLRGRAVILGRPQSWARTLLNPVLSLLVRELHF